VEKYSIVRQAANDNIISWMRFACWITKATDTQNMELFLFFHGNKFTRTRLNVALHVHFWFCFLLHKWCHVRTQSIVKVTVEHTPNFVVNLVCCITNVGRVYITKVDWFTPYRSPFNPFYSFPHYVSTVNAESGMRRIRFVGPIKQYQCAVWATK